MCCGKIAKIIYDKMIGFLFLRVNDMNTQISNSVIYKIWGLFFLYTITVGLSIQLFTLPYIFPDWHAGHGLLSGMDYINFHNQAASIANEIVENGWSAWSLLPNGQLVVGIMSIFYVVITPEPWSILPLNAALHATAGVILLRIINLLTSNWKTALLAVLPFVAFPSSLTWTAQMHNDNYAVLGSLLFIYGWISLSHRLFHLKLLIFIRTLLYIIFGFTLIWLVRPYLVQIFQAISITSGLVITVVILYKYKQYKIKWQKILIVLLAVWSFVLIATPFTENNLSNNKIKQALNQSSKSIYTELESSSTDKFSWQKLPWVPGFIDDKMRAFCYSRWKTSKTWKTVSANNASNIDIEIQFHNTLDAIRYLPRATQIAYLAPFPKHWIGSGSQASSTMMRRESGMEMVFVYFALCGVLPALWHWRKYIEIWLLFIFCSSMLIIFAFAIPNIGSLYRFRYAYLMSMVALGLSMWIKMAHSWHQKK